MTVGLLGPSGAGKSTLLALAPRLYDVPEGQGAVLFDGRDVRDLCLADLRRSVSLVPQQALLFEGTIRSNLLYAAPDATAAQHPRGPGGGRLRRDGRRPPRWAGHPGRRAGPDPLGGPAPAPGPGPRPAGRPGDPAARRLHQRPRRRDRGPRPRRPGRPPPGPDLPDRLAQGVLRPARRPDRRPGGGPDRRSGHPCGTLGTRRPLMPKSTRPADARACPSDGTPRLSLHAIF